MEPRKLSPGSNLPYILRGELPASRNAQVQNQLGEMGITSTVGERSDLLQANGTAMQTALFWMVKILFWLELDTWTNY